MRPQHGALVDGRKACPASKTDKMRELCGRIAHVSATKPGDLVTYITDAKKTC